MDRSAVHMMSRKHCPYCQTPALNGCAHLALAVEARDFVAQCVQLSHGERQWRTLRARRRDHLQRTGEWSPEQEDFTWLETAFCQEFLKPLRWFGGMDYEWRMGLKSGQGGFFALLWSKEPQRLWWELQDQLERLSTGVIPVAAGAVATLPTSSPPPPMLFPIYPPPNPPTPSTPA